MTLAVPQAVPETDASAERIIQVEGLTKYYQDHPAVQDIHFEINRGEIVGFLGPNGAGKSTTMRMLVGAIPASSGSGKISGFDVFEDPLEVKRRVGYLPEVPPVYPDLSVRDQLRFAASLKGIRGSALEKDISTAIERCQLHEYADRLVGMLSKGFRQRVGLAQALLGSPDVLILDEPTVGLDPKQIRVVRDLIRELSRDHTIILSTHILQEVSALCSRVIIIQRGRLVFDAPIVDIATQHPGKTLEEIFLQKVEDGE